MKVSISEARESAQARQRKIDLSPKREDFEKEFGKDRIKDEGGGSWSLSLHDRQEIKRAHQMQEGARQEEIRRGQERHARWDGKRERLVRRDGRVIEMREDLVDQAKARVLPAGRNGGAPSIRFGLSEAFGRYEQGPDGLWFVWNGGWEPTSLFGGKALDGLQRDPDGNRWIKSSGEWLLEDEVA